MAKRPIFTTIGNILTSLPFINANYDAIDDAFDNTISRDGSTPNQMEADLDLNNNNLLNVSNLETDNLSINGQQVTVTNLAVAPSAIDVVITDSAGNYVSGNVEDALAELSTNPFSYLEPSNNLSDLASASTSRDNLGLGNLAIGNFNDDPDFKNVSPTGVARREATSDFVDSKIAESEDRLQDLLITTKFGTFSTTTDGNGSRVLDVTGKSYMSTLSNVDILSGGVTGQHLFLTGASVVSGGSVFDKSSGAVGANIILPVGTASRSILGDSVIHLLYDGGDWIEVSYSDNT